jgi:hypothetical protein
VVRIKYHQPFTIDNVAYVTWGLHYEVMFEKPLVFNGVGE